MIAPETLTTLTTAFPAVTHSEFRGAVRVVAPADSLFSIMQLLRDELKFDLLVDVTCVDYLHFREAEHRFGLVYLLASVESSARLTVRVYLDEPHLTVASVVPLWKGADWMEREVYDMFGILFEGHPDLRRILLPDDFTAFPLRKDYPLQGRGERHNFPVLTRREG